MPLRQFLVTAAALVAPCVASAQHYQPGQKRPAHTLEMFDRLKRAATR